MNELKEQKQQQESMFFSQMLEKNQKEKQKEEQNEEDEHTQKLRTDLSRFNVQVIKPISEFEAWVVGKKARSEQYNYKYNDLVQVNPLKRQPRQKAKKFIPL